MEGKKMNKKFLDQNAKKICTVDFRDPLYHGYAGEKTYYYLDGDVWVFTKHLNNTVYTGKSGCDPLGTFKEVLENEEYSEYALRPEYFDSELLDALRDFKAKNDL